MVTADQREAPEWSRRRHFRWNFTRTPEPHTIEEAKAGAIEDFAIARVVADTEVDCASEDPLETVRESPVRHAVVIQAERVEHLGARPEIRRPTLLLNGERSGPDDRKMVLAKRMAVIGIAVDLSEKAAIPSPMHEHIWWRTLERHAAKHKRSCTEHEALLAFGTLLPNKLDDLDLL